MVSSRRFITSRRRLPQPFRPHPKRPVPPSTFLLGLTTPYSRTAYVHTSSPFLRPTRTHAAPGGRRRRRRARPLTPTHQPTHSPTNPPTPTLRRPHLTLTPPQSTSCAQEWLTMHSSEDEPNPIPNLKPNPNQEWLAKLVKEDERHNGPTSTTSATSATSLPQLQYHGAQTQR